MKKEWFAAALLIGVILGSAFNLRHLKSITGKLDARVEEAVSAADSGNWTLAETLASGILQDWTRMDKYTHIFIRHGEIDAVTDGFCSLLGAMRSNEPGSLYAAQLALRCRLAELYEMERVTPGSIL
jgi:hypothetical protein